MTKQDNLPAGWRMVLLRDVIENAQSGFASGERDPNGVVQLRMNNVDTRGNITWDDYIRVPTTQEQLSKYCLSDGDVVFNNTNSVELVGKSALFKPLDEPVVYSNHFTRLRVRRDLLDPGFLTSWLMRQWQAKLFEKICNRWIGQSAVKPQTLLDLEMPLPPIEEQRRIVGVLEEKLAAVEQARQAAEAQLEAARGLSAAYLRQVFDGREAQAWPKLPLQDIAILERGKFTPRPRNDPKYFGGSIPWIQTGRVESSGKYITEFDTTLNEMGLGVSRMFPKGTLVITIAATIGAVGILDFDSCMPDSLVGITPIVERSEVEYLYYALLFVREHLKSIAPQAAQANLNLGILRRLEIPVPNINEQRRIATELEEKNSRISTLLKALEEQIKEIRCLPSSYLQQAFNGEL